MELSRNIASSISAQPRTYCKGMNTPEIELTHRQLEVLQRVSLGQADKQIALHLHISVRTVESHVANLLGKTGTYRRTQLAAYAREHSLVN